MPSNQFKAFFKAYSEKIKDLDYMEKSLESLDKYPLLPSQAIYVVNWKTIKIDYQRGIDKLLGYSKEEFNHDLLSEFYHPDDIHRYVYLVKLTNEWARKLKPARVLTFQLLVAKMAGYFPKMFKMKRRCRSSARVN